MKVNNISLLICGFALLLVTSCQKDFLDKQPTSSITPENYLVEESQLGSYAINRYGIFPSNGNTWFGQDMGTDIMTGLSFDNKYIPGQWKVGQSGGDWSFTDIYQCNYFFKTVLPRFRAGTIGGNPVNIKHYIGEMYMIRAYVYFGKLQALGDFPILREILPDDKAILTAASKRAPCNEVARFIMSDLDSAILMMKPTSIDGNKNRLAQPAAQLLKSRVALYEATWLKYFKGTAFVPNGTGWPGATKDYNKSYAYPSGSIDAEISYFLTQAMTASKIVADASPLTTNNGVVQQSLADPVNPYFNMFSDVNLAGYGEVLFWRAYDLGLGVVSKAPLMVVKSDQTGVTRGFIDGFLMANGLPIYAANSGYAGDDSIQPIRKNRDGRLNLFLMQPGQLNLLIRNPIGDHSVVYAPYPDILNSIGDDYYATGYAMRKGMSYDEVQYGMLKSTTGSIVFRAAEAYLNYIEASYEKNGNLDATADAYWRAIRSRGGLNPNYQVSIDATDMAKAGANDWGAYSAGVFVDKTLYNIRLERRCELFEESQRVMDLKRWRAMDQMIATPYHIEGFKLWGPMQNWYKTTAGVTKLKYGVGNSSNVSAPTLSLYYRPYEKVSTGLAYGGFKWTMAHYLNPIAIEHFMITSPGTDYTASPIYQNPGWGLVPNVGPAGF